MTKVSRQHWFLLQSSLNLSQSCALLTFLFRSRPCLDLVSALCRACVNLVCTLARPCTNLVWTFLLCKHWTCVTTIAISLWLFLHVWKLQSLLLNFANNKFMLPEFCAFVNLRASIFDSVSQRDQRQCSCVVALAVSQARKPCRANPSCLLVSSVWDGV